MGEQSASSSAGGGGLTMPPSEISGLNAGHVDLAALGMGPLGGVGEVLQAEAPATPVQLAVSAPTAPGQGLLALFGLTHTGTMSSAVHSRSEARERNPGPAGRQSAHPLR